MAEPSPPIEVNGPPLFEPGQRVRAIATVRNDGTFYGMPRGAPLIDAGDIGYVKSVGEFLLRYYIYDVDFVEKGRVVGMRGFELEDFEGERRVKQ